MSHRYIAILDSAGGTYNFTHSCESKWAKFNGLSSTQFLCIIVWTECIEHRNHWVCMCLVDTVYHKRKPIEHTIYGFKIKLPFTIHIFRCGLEFVWYRNSSHISKWHIPAETKNTWKWSRHWASQRPSRLFFVRLFCMLRQANCIPHIYTERT